MAGWDDVHTLALGMPGAEEQPSRGDRAWRVNGKLFVWERPLRPRDREELGARTPEGPILGAAVADEGEKLALVSAEPEIFFTTSHFDGYPAVLVRLDVISVERLGELVAEAWLVKAPTRLKADYED